MEVYPLVIEEFATENGHRNSWFTHEYHDDVLYSYVSLADSKQVLFEKKLWVRVCKIIVDQS